MTSAGPALWAGGLCTCDADDGMRGHRDRKDIISRRAVRLVATSTPCSSFCPTVNLNRARTLDAYMQPGRRSCSIPTRSTEWCSLAAEFGSMERCHFPMLLQLHDRGPRSQGTLLCCPIGIGSYCAKRPLAKSNQRRKLAEGQ